MKRIALDTTAVNDLADTPAVLEAAQQAHALGRVVFIVSHVIHDELSATHDPIRRDLLLKTWEAMPKVVVPTRGAIWDISKLDQMRFGDGSESGVTLDEVRPDGEPRDETHEDALIATTASGDADVLVTNDGGLATKVRDSRARCEVWSFGKLRRFLVRGERA